MTKITTLLDMWKNSILSISLQSPVYWSKNHSSLKNQRLPSANESIIEPQSCIKFDN